MSRDIIKLDQIDVTFHQKKRTITAVKDVTIHPRRGYLRNRWYSGAGEINPYGWLTSAKTICIIDDDVIFDGKTTSWRRSSYVGNVKIGMIFQHFNLSQKATRRGKYKLLPSNTLDLY